MNRRRWLVWLLGVGMLVGGLAWAAQAGVAYWQRRAAPIFLTAKVTRGRIESVVNSTGTVKPVRSVQVGAFISGPILEINVDFNSRVKKDQILARIDPRLVEATVERDRATLQTQEADLARIDALLQQARNNEERANKLLTINKDYLSDTEMDQYRYTRQGLEAQRKLAQAMIAQARANLKTSEANLAFTEIRSPVDGIVIERKVDPGQTVASAFQTPELFTVAPEMERHMHVFASVDEADIGQIRSAQERRKSVNFTVDAYPQDLFSGQIYQVRRSSTTVQNVVTYPVVIEAKNPDLKLMPGMTASISFLIEARDNVVRIPAAALRYVPAAAQVHPDDRHYLSGASSSDQAVSGTRLSASQKTEMARSRTRRIVWVQEGHLLRAVPVILGLIDNQFGELIEGDLDEDQDVVVGSESAAGRRSS